MFPLRPRPALDEPRVEVLARVRSELNKYHPNPDCKYDSLRSKHMLNQYFPYEERAEAATLVDHLRQRQDDRAAAGHAGQDDEPQSAQDKRINPLLAIPGSKGSGKSTFLVHLPESKAFGEAFDNPIVSTLTFNSAMTFKRPVFGLRILFGKE